MNFRYIIGAIISIPLLPLLYIQGKKIKAKIPDIPPAKGKVGSVNRGSNKTLKLLVMGESTMAGIGVETHEAGYAGTIAKELSAKLDVNIDWKVYAQSGYTAKQVKEKLVPEITEEEADLIILGLGGNDSFQLNTPWRWQTDIQNLITALRSKFEETPIAFNNMPPIKDFPVFTPLMQFIIGNLGEILGDALKIITQGQKDIYYNSARLTVKGLAEKYDLEPNHSVFFSDGVHPSEITYQILAKDFAGFLMDNQIECKLLKN